MDVVIRSGLRAEFFQKDCKENPFNGEVCTIMGVLDNYRALILFDSKKSKRPDSCYISEIDHLQVIHEGNPLEEL